MCSYDGRNLRYAAIKRKKYFTEEDEFYRIDKLRAREGHLGELNNHDHGVQELNFFTAAGDNKKILSIISSFFPFGRIGNDYASPSHGISVGIDN
jgi:hypothetical protein